LRAFCSLHRLLLASGTCGTDIFRNCEAGQIRSSSLNGCRAWPSTSSCRSARSVRWWSSRKTSWVNVGAIPRFSRQNSAVWSTRTLPLFWQSPHGWHSSLCCLRRQS